MTPSQEPTTSPLLPLKMLEHKNLLQRYTQKSTIPPPFYQTLNEGSQHSPKFRSIVTVDGDKFTSSNTFFHIKEAEQDAARVALEVLESKIKQLGCHMLHEDAMFSKSILNELATKIGVPFPTYEITTVKGGYQMFTSTVTFHGEKYSGPRARSKKEAEQMAARAAIESLSGTSHGNMIFQILIVKRKIFAALHGSGETNLSQTNLLGEPSRGTVPYNPSSLAHTFASQSHQNEGTIGEGDRPFESRSNTAGFSASKKRRNRKKKKDEHMKKLRTEQELVSASTSSA